MRGVLFGGSETLVRSAVDRDAGRPRVEPAPGATEALAAVREAGVPVGVVSTTRRGELHSVVGPAEESRRVQVGRCLGPFDAWRSCLHRPHDRCQCRGPAPRLVLQAAADLGVASHRVAVISDVGPDLRAAQAAGAVGILVPSRHTLRAEAAEAPLVAPDLVSAVRAVLGIELSWVPGS